MLIIALIANRFINKNFYLSWKSSGRTGPNFSMVKSWQKPPKDVPSFGNLPERESQAKAHAYSAWSRIASSRSAELEANPRWTRLTPQFIASKNKKSIAKNLSIASATVNTVRLGAKRREPPLRGSKAGGIPKGESLWRLLLPFRRWKGRARAARALE